MKLLVILNESKYGSHSDVHSALATLRTSGSIEAYKIYPFLERLSNG